MTENIITNESMVSLEKPVIPRKSKMNIQQNTFILANRNSSLGSLASNTDLSRFIQQTEMSTPMFQSPKRSIAKPVAIAPSPPLAIPAILFSTTSSSSIVVHPRTSTHYKAKKSMFWQEKTTVESKEKEKEKVSLALVNVEMDKKV